MNSGKGGGAGVDRDDGGWDRDRGLLWKLPVLNVKHETCAGLGPGIPGLQLGFGLGVGCGVGLGFGYGIGKGVAYDESPRYSNVGKLFHGPGNLPSQDDIGALVDELVVNTRKLIRVTVKEID
ncbi:hypothetical protein Ancab_038505 [Ancistrocladus abbreviatus]